ncbi:IclR family transcriptional regulator [Variovorax sp. KK3]|uniref:IclR family transcriptional regulator n=1 Tax=Variovorax sp. KK3 TaxID=1855728 RepID=UPI00097BB33E|nr:IclR family transcriptional regulator [Variovorax sp. KK3]
MTATATPSGGVLTVARGMQVLRAFRSDRASLSNAELVRRTGLSKATVSRLTSTLLQLGALQRVPGGREFELGAAPVGIGHAYLAGSDLQARVNPYLQDLADRLDVSVALAVRDDMEMLYLGYRVGHKVATLRLGQGSVLPLGTTSIGHAYLWGLPPAEREALVATVSRAYGAGAAQVERAIHQSFRDMEANGTCAVLGGYQRDAYGVALPVRLGRRGIVMGLSCGKADMQPDLAAEQRRIAPVLRNAAKEFEKAMADFEGMP